jgi:hypothetical protein
MVVMETDISKNAMGKLHQSSKEKEFVQGYLACSMP